MALQHEKARSTWVVDLDASGTTYVVKAMDDVTKFRYHDSGAIVEADIIGIRRRPQCSGKGTFDPEVLRMYSRRVLSQEQCQAAIAAVTAEFKTMAGSLRWTMAIVDDAGNLMAFTRSDGAGPMLGRNCIKKAYTSAMTGSSTKVFGELRPGETDFAANLKEHDWQLSEYGDPMLMVISGGICVRDPVDNTIMGGIGVSGLPYGPGDHDMALVALKAMGLDSG